MNLLEHYIEKVVSVEDVTKEWEEDIRKAEPNFIETDPMLQVRMIVNCCGNTRKSMKLFHKTEWEKIQEQGYYMA